MFKTLSNSWTLAQECWDVLIQDKEMLVYPTLTSVVNLGILFMAYFYFLGIGFLDSSIPFQYTAQQWTLGALLLVCTMYACHFSFSFFECALVASAIKRLGGENPTLSYGLGVAANRIPQIAWWSFYCTVFGLFLMLLKSVFRGKWLQKIVGKMAETVWNVVTVFVLPLIVLENMDATSAAKKSTSMVKKRWGEAATLEIGFGSLTTITAMPLTGLFMVTAMLQEVSPFLSDAIFFLTIALGAFLGVLLSALTGIAKAVLFNYITGGNVPDAVHKEILDGVVVHRDDDGAIIDKPIQT